MKIQKLYYQLLSLIKEDYPNRGFLSSLKTKWFNVVLLKHRIRYKLVGFLFGKNLFVESKDIAELAFFIENYSSLNSESKYKVTKKVKFLLEQSRKHYQTGSFSQARSFIDQAKDLDPTNPLVYSSYSLLNFFESGDTASYREAKIKKVELLRSQPTIWRNIYQYKVIDHEWTYAIGHLTIIDKFLKAKYLGLLNQSEHSIFTTADYIANKCYLDYFSDHLHINILSREKYWMYSKVFSPDIENISAWEFQDGLKQPCRFTIEDSWHDQGRQPLLVIKDQHRQRGLDILEKLFIPRDAWFVALHVRGNGYRLNSRDIVDGRNSLIDSYIPAIKAITSAGGYVLRMGHSSMKPLPPMPNVIDYIHSPYKSDWMDVFLWACCRFFIGTVSGPLEVPGTFGVPCLLTNANAFGTTSGLSRLMIPKLWYSNRYKRLLTFSEILDSPAGWCERRTIDELDIILVDNSTDEIESGVKEMLDITSSGLISFSKTNHLSSDSLQMKLNLIRKKYNVRGQSPVSSYFLDKHRNLVE